MTGTERPPPPGHALFARYAFPPNELGYCGPPGAGAPPAGDATDLARYAREFDGAWQYLSAIADAAGIADPLDEHVVRTYWVGGPLLDRIDPVALLVRLRDAFSGQVSGLLAEVAPDNTSANHSFHVFVVYPWARFLDRDPTTPLQVMQDCRIRWGVVDEVHDEHAMIVSRPLRFDSGVLDLGEPAAERVRWRRGDSSLAPAPVPGQRVSAHWDWICDALTAAEVAALESATRRTLTLVNAALTGCRTRL